MEKSLICTDMRDNLKCPLLALLIPNTGCVNDNLRIQPEILDTLSGKQIWALPSQSLKIESAGNVTMKARNNKGFLTNILSLGEAGLQAMGNYFLILGD
ncbi:hypothetical protein CEXT_522931 [Caerostris extrusa]|uniref:Uncharacterized protein n=1 Tax=Caerostris extrusa TaxID=172846 RepID=A0AAV4QYK2_CAEEX|nr:hypothetical protein CEXT_522931 [Caerostris extrusa]